MKMKNVFMLLLGAMLILSMVSMVSAETITAETITDGDNTDDVQVTLILSQLFQVEIPADIELQKEGENLVYSGFNWLNATVNLLNQENGLVVNITSSNVNHIDNEPKLWNLTSPSGSVAKYIIGYSTNTNYQIDENSDTLVSEQDQVIAIKESGNKTELCMHYKLVTPVHQLKTETYTDTLTFGVYILPKVEVGEMPDGYLTPLSA